jgi:glyoxylase-like metal-dependent hydrolase (beta-lactamase superfamily II)
LRANACNYPRNVTDTAPRPKKQEQLPASDQILEIAPGVLRTQLPISIPGLGHVNMYVLEDERGVAVVDPGLPDKNSYAMVKKRLQQVGVPLKNVHTVIVTHSHPDHFGGAYWLRADTGCDVVTHERFRVFWDPTEPDDVDLDDQIAVDELSNRPPVRRPWDPPPWGGPSMEVPWRRRARMAVARRIPRMLHLPQPTVRLKDAQTFRFARREWVAVHTPGHTADHLCLFDPEHGLMLCGDHVLPTITPHISGLMRARDPLKLFFDSLDKVASFGPQVTKALPAHGDVFTDLTGRAMDIKEHHVGRLQKLRDAAAAEGRPMTVMDMSTHLFSPRAQGGMADSETFAHLEHLRLTGEMVRTDRDGRYEYTLSG